MSTGTLYHTDPKPKAFGKKDTQIRGKVYAGSEMAQPRGLRGKSGWMVGLCKERSRNMAGKN